MLLFTPLSQSKLILDTFYFNKSAFRTPSSSREDPIKSGLSVRPDVLFELDHQFFKFQFFKVCVTKLNLKKKHPKNGENGPKTGFFCLLKNVVINSYFFCSESSFNLLCPSTNLIFVKNLVSDI